ncbi:hypothetical protein Hanom_Chr02g00138631 [Helianthus anomalus]
MPITVPSSSFEFSNERDVSLDEAAGSSGGIHNENNHIEGLYLPTIAWDPCMPNRPYKPRWKIAESTCLIYPHVVSHWDCGQLLDSTLTDIVSRVKRIAKTKCRWGQDNHEIHQTRQAMQQMMDELQRRDSLVDDAKDLRRVTSNLAEERVIWARDYQEIHRLISHALKTQKELERKAVMEVEKVRALSPQVARLVLTMSLYRMCKNSILL